MDNIINPILKPENDQSNWKDWQNDSLSNEFLKPKNDPVNHPSHYTDGKIEVIDFIEDKNLGFHLGNAVKYISRAGKKDPNKEIEDLEKAVWYVNRRIEFLKSNKKPQMMQGYPVDPMMMQGYPVDPMMMQGYPVDPMMQGYPVDPMITPCKKEA